MKDYREMTAEEEPVSARCDTGTSGLNHILRGGFPLNALYLVQGDPGVGKTTLALQFLLAGARAGESCLYITFSETSAELFAVARSHGWSLDAFLPKLSVSNRRGPFSIRCPSCDYFHRAPFDIGVRF